MGGTVAETIRRENGEVIKMARKTGAYNWMFFTKEFCEEKFDLAIDNHVKAFTQMKEDYQSGEPYKYPMSPLYGWCNETAPIDYGLIVIDFKKKKIHSMQSYDTPGTHYVSMLSKHVILEKDTEYHFNYLIKNNLLNIITNDDKTSDINDFFGSNFTLEKLRKKLDNSFIIIKNILGKENSLRSALFSPKSLNNFKLLKYEETPEGTLKFFEELVNDGFLFEKSELDMWKSKINDFDSDYFLEDKDYENEKLADQISENNKNLILEKIDSLAMKVFTHTKSFK